MMLTFEKGMSFQIWPIVFFTSQVVSNTWDDQLNGCPPEVARNHSPSWLSEWMVESSWEPAYVGEES